MDTLWNDEKVKLLLSNENGIVLLLLKRILDLLGLELDYFSNIIYLKQRSNQDFFGLKDIEYFLDHQDLYYINFSYLINDINNYIIDKDRYIENNFKDLRTIFITLILVLIKNNIEYEISDYIDAEILNNNDINDIIESMFTHTHITVLKIPCFIGNRFNDDDDLFNKFCNHLTTHKHITELNIKCCNLDSENDIKNKLSKLCNVIKDSNITTLRLNECNLTDISQLSTLLKEHDMVCIDISDNCIGAAPFHYEIGEINHIAEFLNDYPEQSNCTVIFSNNEIEKKFEKEINDIITQKKLSKKIIL